MYNYTNQRILLVTEADGEVLGTVEPHEGFNIRSKKQAERDKTYKPIVKKEIRSEFVKYQLNDTEIADKFRDYPEAYFAFLKMLHYLEIGSNLLKKKGKPYKASDLADELKVVRQTAYAYIKKMKEVDLIRKVEVVGQGQFFAVNPYYFMKGDKLPDYIIDLFPKPKIKKENN